MERRLEMFSGEDLARLDEISRRRNQIGERKQYLKQQMGEREGKIMGLVDLAPQAANVAGQEQIEREIDELKTEFQALDREDMNLEADSLRIQGIILTEKPVEAPLPEVSEEEPAAGEKAA